jgi:arylamine N-acetyltransferase
MDQTQKVWIYHARSDHQSPWIPQYSFSEVEFLFEDFNMMNFFTSRSRSILFTQKLACTRVILDDQGLEPLGIYILAGREIKRVLRETTETLQTFNAEEDRVSALVKYFNMNFHEHELEGVRGLPSQIKPR